ncbi:MAG: hypothetical protein PHI66_02120 [Candidatus Pacebacteria bacterium]|nr:hypothetical protein [Candidatus Paceibacterota bacterium]
MEEIALAQSGQEALENYLRNIGYDPSIKEFMISYREGNEQKNITVSNEAINIGLVKILMALKKILPIQDADDQLALSTLLSEEYNTLLIISQTKDNYMILPALLIKRMGLLRKELGNIEPKDIKIKEIK